MKIFFNSVSFFLVLFISSCDSSGSASSAASTDYTLIVPDSTGQSIQFYDANSEGNEFPNRVIYGINTQLLDPRAVAFSSSNEELYVCDAGNMGVLVYTYEDIRMIDEITGTANILPRDIIGGSNTLMNTPINCEVNNNELYVLDSNKVIVFDLSQLSRSGSLTPNNLTPARTLLGGSIATLTSAKDFTLVGDKILISNGDEIHVYPKTADGNSEPLRILTDSNDSNDRSFNDILSLVSDGNTFLYVMNKNISNVHHLSLYVYDDSEHTAESTVDLSVHVSYRSDVFQENPLSFIFDEGEKDFFVLNQSTTPVDNSISKFSIYDSGDDSTPSLTPIKGANVQLDTPTDIKIIEKSIID